MVFHDKTKRVVNFILPNLHELRNKTKAKSTWFKSLSRKNTFRSVSWKPNLQKQRMSYESSLSFAWQKNTPSWWLWSSVSLISLWLIAFIGKQKKYLWNAIWFIYEIRIYDSVFGLNLIEWCSLYVRGCLNYEIYE